MTDGAQHDSLTALLKNSTTPSTTSYTTTVIEDSTTDPSKPKIITAFAESPCLYIYLVLNLCVGISIIVLNMFVFVFYVKRIKGREKNHIYYCLYILLSSSDMVAGLAALAHAVLLGFTINFTRPVLIPMSYLVLFLSSLSSHLSVFLNATISILRTLYIIRPTRAPRYEFQLIFGASLVYGIVWLVFCIVDVVKYENFNLAFPSENIYLFIMIAPRVNVLFQHFSRRDSNLLMYGLIAIGIPYVLPTLICILCSTVQIVKLIVVPVSRRSHINQKITVTILALTLVFFLCNTPYMVYYLVAYADWQKKGEFITSAEQTLICYFMAHFPGFLNALLNPIILISRGRRLKRFTFEAVSELVNKTNVQQVMSMNVTSNWDAAQGAASELYPTSSPREGEGCSPREGVGCSPTKGTGIRSAPWADVVADAGDDL